MKEWSKGEYLRCWDREFQREEAAIEKHCPPRSGVRGVRRSASADQRISSMLVQEVSEAGGGSVVEVFVGDEENFEEDS